jgi:hypothetical protein
MKNVLLALVTLAGAAAAQEPNGAGQTLPNGIQLPANWPPRLKEVSREPSVPAYLTNPPAVIPIDVGRQLLVDDFLVAETTLKRTFHRAQYHPASPVLKPDKPWEMQGGAMAMPYSDGLFYDPKDQLFKMWYMGGYCTSTCYATSKDGITWEKPALDVVPGTNKVSTLYRDSCTVMLDLAEKDPARRYKMFRMTKGGSIVKNSYGLALHFSADGIHWTPEPVLTGPAGDRSVVFWNPFRERYVFNLRHGWGRPRLRRYWEARDLLKDAQWPEIVTPTFWTGADKLDYPHPGQNIVPELYHMEAFAYENLIVGLFSIGRGDLDNKSPVDPGRPKPNDICVGFSRDGFHWYRPDHKPVFPYSENPADWNWGNIQPVGGGGLIVGDKLYVYVSGRKGMPDGRRDAGGSTGLAILRRDGFASMDAEGEGTLTTRPLRFARGKKLFVNLQAPGGELRADVLDEKGQVLKQSVAVTGDSTIAPVAMKGGGDLASLSGKTVRFRFHLKKGKLYSFWVSPDDSGASHGYVAAGGPGFTGPWDTVGSSGYPR